MEVGFGRGVGRKGNGMMRERMKTEEKMRWNTMTLEFESRPCNESACRCKKTRTFAIFCFEKLRH